MPSAVRAFLLALAAGLVLLLAIGLADGRGFRLDVPSDSQVLVRPGQERCSAIIRPPGAGADRVRFWVRPAAGNGSVPPVVVFVRRSRTAQTLADGTAAAGAEGARTVRLRGSVAGSRKVVACFLAGAQPVVLLPRPGTPTRVTVERSDATADYADIGLELERSRDRSLLALIPDAFDRAALFRPGWVGAWTYWLLLGALVIGVPVLLSRALASAAASDEDEAPSDSSRASTSRWRSSSSA